VEALWGGALPALDNLDAVNELLGALMMGLWNRLTRHQEPSAPFRLTRQDTPASREGLAALARLRREELEGFIAGLYGDQEGIDVPERADKALDVLAELRAMVHATQVLAEDASKPAEPGEIAVTIRQFRELTRIAEHEMHEVVLSCTRARRQMMPTRPARRPTVH
jgi:hypothetical protein